MDNTLKKAKLTTKQIEIIGKYGCHSVDEVLQLYPFRYEELVYHPFNEWKEKDRVIFEGTVVTYPKTIRYQKNRTITKFQIETQDMYLNAVLYNHPWTTALKVGHKFCFIGTYSGNNQVIVAQYNQNEMNTQLGIIPIYPLKENIQQRSIKAIIRKIFTSMYHEIDDFIPSHFIVDYKLLRKKDALRMIHFPKSNNEIQQAYRTLKYEEFLKFHLAIQLLRNELHDDKIEGKQFDLETIYDLIDRLPFDCTPDQMSVIDEILSDMRSSKTMYRLVQGDVGCGKTVVAWFSMLACVLSGKQSALMAPTEILAKQHYQSFLELSQDYPLKIEVLYSSLSNTKKKEIIERLKNNDIDICIGTHSLIQDSVQFFDLGLVVADEQHRFGVEQRRKLKDKGNNVDFILMSATPIPRTLANTMYGDMDVSTIFTMPKNRKNVITKVINKNCIDDITDHIEKHVLNGEQIYVVCAAIEESETLNIQNINAVGKIFNEKFKKIAKIGLLHGKMNSDEKEFIMNQFDENEIQILISTTVVEVGVNVVNATMMIIMDAHRFGLSTLHQLRGRVRRGNKEGYCYLLSDTSDSNSLARLKILENSNDGFEISLQDLKNRGPGDILGIRQSGLPGFILGDLFEDTRIIETAKKDANTIIMNSDKLEYKKCIQCVTNKRQYMD